jgi:hypothetical protein
MSRLVLVAVAAAWVLVAMLALSARRADRRRADARWHRALDTLESWQPDDRPVAPAITWCHVSATAAGIPGQRSGAHDQRVAAER